MYVLARKDKPAMLVQWQLLCQTLTNHEVRYLVAGSIAAMLHGVKDIHPGDVDIIPCCKPHNLRRLATVLHILEATTTIPEGAWYKDEQDEWRWKTDMPSETERAAWRWQPDEQHWQTFDHSFSTRYGMLDCVPQIAGTYEDLIQRAMYIDTDGPVIAVVSLEDLLARITIPRRAKDAARVQQLRAIQQQRLQAKQD